MKFTEKLRIYIFVYILSVVVALVLLVGCAYMPQAAVNKNVLTSAQQMESEDKNPYFADHSVSTRMSFNSEALMLIESKGLDEQHLENVLANNTYTYEGSNGQRDNLLPFAQGEKPASVQPYSRYWMGFRVTLRLLLQKLDYFQIRRYTAIVFFILFAAAISSISKHSDSVTAVLFAVSIALVNPHVIAVSLQNFTCFCIAFIAMILIPWISRKPKWEGVFFMEIGIVTMYFDFYTNPLVTFGLPMIYLYLLKGRYDNCYSLKRVGKDALAWLCGYVFMWLAKLILTSLFTSENAIVVGLMSFLFRIRINDTPRFDEGYGPLDAVRKVFHAVRGDVDGGHILGIVTVMMVLVFVFLFIKNKKPIHSLADHKELLVIALMPVAWISVASQPVVIHYYCQYRVISVAFWAILCYLYLSVSEKKCKISSNESD